MRFQSASVVSIVLTLARPCGAIAAQQADELLASVVSIDAMDRPVIRAVPLAQPLRVDGVLDEKLYQTTRPVDRLIQLLPQIGEPASERTEAWVSFDREYIYVSARCWNSAPQSTWIADEMHRDSSRVTQGEMFGVLLDTFHDRRSGYSLTVNPLGGRVDTQYASGVANINWNGVWHVRTGRFEAGWTVEIAIPFKSLRYRSGSNETWGIQFRRGIAHKNEWAYLTRLPASTPPQSGMRRIADAATLIGLELPPASRNMEFKPYVISELVTDRGRTPTVVNETDVSAGFDFKYGVTANLTADLTVNTDFAQVEVDEQQVNLTRFNLFFPEKREFFLEGQTYFDFGTGSALAESPSADTPSLFYSRRIGLAGNTPVPLNVGGRLTGKVGAFGVGVVAIRTGEEVVSGARPTDFTVIRVRRDVLRRSTIGAVFTNRSLSTVGSGSNQTFGADVALSLFEDVTVSGFVARTKTGGLAGDDGSQQMVLEYGADRYGARLEYLAVGAHFNPEVGFVRRSDFKRGVAKLRFSPRPAPPAIVRQYTFESTLEYTLSGEGLLESRQQQARFHTEFESSDELEIQVARKYEHLVRPFAVKPGSFVPIGSYPYTDAQLAYRLGQKRRHMSGSFTWRVGSFYDGTINALELSSARIPYTSHVALTPSFSINRIALPTDRFTTAVVRLRGEYNFSPQRFVSALVQYNSTERIVSANIRLRWEYHPGSELFVVYTNEHDTFSDERDGVAGRRGLPIENHAFVVKINRLLRF